MLASLKMSFLLCPAATSSKLSWLMEMMLALLVCTATRREFARLPFCLMLGCGECWLGFKESLGDFKVSSMMIHEALLLFNSSIFRLDILERTTNHIG